MERPSTPPHPAVWMILFLPFGATSGFVSVTVAYLAKREGLSDSAVAALVAMNLLPHTWKFLWAPVVDTSSTRRRWYLASNLLAAVTLVAVGFAPVRADTLAPLQGLILLNSLATTFLGMAVEGLLAHVATPEQRGRASGWLQAGNLGGAGIGGGAALWLAARLGVRAAVVLVALALLGCSLAALRLREPPRERPPAGGAAGAVRDVLVDLWSTVLASRTGLLAVVLCFLPVGAAAASALFSAMAERWGASSDEVALYTGVLGGVVAALGCMAGGWLSDALDRKTAYAVSGFFLAAVAVGMCVAPRSAATYGLFTLSYAFGSGVSYGAFTGFVLEAIGRGAAATKYNALASLSNVPIYYMIRVDGWASDRWGPGRMLLVDAATEVGGAVLFLGLAALLLGRRVTGTRRP